MPSALSSLEPVRGLGFREISPIAKVQWLLHLGLKKLLNLLGLQPINHSPPTKKNSYPISPKWICMTLEFATKNVCLRTFPTREKNRKRISNIHPSRKSIDLWRHFANHAFQEEQLKAISAEEKANPREFAKVPRPDGSDGNGLPSDERR